MVINEELRTAVYQDMPDYTDPLMKATYIYIKLCKLLSYDEAFYAANQKGKIAEFHENREHLSEITPTNNNVVCYEFAEIYKEFLTELGIEAYITKPKGKDLTVYGKDHTYVKFKINNVTFTADSTLSVFTGDLFACKLNLPVQGLRSDDESIDIKSYINKAYKDILLPVVSDEKNNPDHIDNTLKRYQSLTHNIKEITLKERLDTIIKKANSSTLKGFDRIIYLNYLLCFLIPYKDKYNVKMVFVRDNTTDELTARAIIEVYEEYIDDVGDYHYYSYGSDHELKEIPVDELQAMFDNHELEYIKEEDMNKTKGVRM